MGIIMNDPTGKRLKIEIIIRRAEFSNKYCADRGWDMDTLTLEQVMEIREQPEWADAGGGE